MVSPREASLCKYLHNNVGRKSACVGWDMLLEWASERRLGRGSEPVDSSVGDVVGPRLRWRRRRRLRRSETASAATLVGDGVEGDVGNIVGRSSRLRRRWSEAALVATLVGDGGGDGVGDCGGRRRRRRRRG
jgi:hypothetical protein